MTPLDPGTPVRVDDRWPEAGPVPVHIRTPHYVRGRQGTVVAALGRFPDPECLAFHRPAPPRMLYHVAFPAEALWPDEGRPGDSLVVELYEHWLSPLEPRSMTAHPDETTRSDAALAALLGLLADRGLVAAAEIDERIAATEKASPAQGARMVARAWSDPAYRARLLADGSAAAGELGISLVGAPPLGVLENRPGLHHLVVCTLCSCYPRAVLGYPPHWYKSSAYRARAVRDPRGVLAEWGLVLPDTTRLRVVDSTADYRWMVLPTRPAGSEALDEPALAALVRDTDMLGITVPALGHPG